MTTRIGEWLAWTGISQREIAADLGVTQAAISAAVKRGSRPRWLRDLADLIGVPPDALMRPPERSPDRLDALARAGLRRLAKERARRG
jgi:transcriptional regulator with XRE-family HTH domain